MLIYIIMYIYYRCLDDYIYIYISSTDILDLLTPILPIVYRLWQVFRATSRILT